MIIFIDVEKAFDKVQHAFMINVLVKLGPDRAFLKRVKVIYCKPTANIIVNGKTN